MAMDRQQGIVIAAGLTLSMVAGCLALDNKAKEAPTGTPVQSLAVWQSFVVFGSDPTREGTTRPGLAGRLYLLGSQDINLAAPGKVQVRLYADPPNPGAPDVPLEIWDLDSETLKGKLQRDLIGWGYSLLLPWSTYRPDLTHIRLTVRFEPTKGGAPLYAPETHLTLQAQGPPTITSSTTSVIPKGEQ
jgi:hypothetical protein